MTSVAASIWLTANEDMQVSARLRGRPGSRTGERDATVELWHPRAGRVAIAAPATEALAAAELFTRVADAFVNLAAEYGRRLTEPPPERVP